MPELTITLTDASALRALFDEQLAKKRAFLPGAEGVAAHTSCDLVLKHGEKSHRLCTEVVYVKVDEPGRGVGLQIAMDEAALAALRAFVELVEDGAEDGGDAAREANANVALQHMHERIRMLTSAEQQKMAANGTLSERIALERMYGPNVWEVLLRNPRITLPEVARIARKGTIPRPLLEAIAANGAWIATGEVQRAILSNPRATTVTIGRILGTMSRGEIARTGQQTAYPMTVRTAAKKLLGG